MKKTYTKPQIMFESFTLSTNIAGSCEKDTNLQSNNSCGVYSTGVGVVFLDTIQGCTDFKVTTDGSGDGYIGSGSGPDTLCYHVPFGSNLFNS